MKMVMFYECYFSVSHVFKFIPFITGDEHYNKMEVLICFDGNEK